MKKWMLFLIGFILISGNSPKIWADGIPGEANAPTRHHYYSHKKSIKEPKEEALPPPAPICVSNSEPRKVRLLSWDPVQKVNKLLGVIQECVTTQWDILKLLSGPNVIGLHYPDEKEMWGYVWLWSYKLQNPLEDTIILMDRSGKRIMKGKNPVELYITFNKEDVVERVEMTLIKKKNKQYVLFP